MTQKKSSGTTAVLDAPHRSKTRELGDILARARKLAAEAIGIDSHIDTVQRVLVMGEDLGKRLNVGLARARLPLAMVRSLRETEV